MIKPEEVEFVFDNEGHQTSTVGIGTTVKDERGREKLVITRKVVPRAEGRQLAKLLEDRKKEIDKIKSAAAKENPRAAKELKAIESRPPRTSIDMNMVAKMARGIPRK